jgi:hypothetical protein
MLYGRVLLLDAQNVGQQTGSPFTLNGWQQGSTQQKQGAAILYIHNSKTMGEGESNSNSRQRGKPRNG